MVNKESKSYPSIIYIHRSFLVIAAILLLPTSCAPLSIFSPPTSTPTPTGTKVVLPATWTELPPTLTITPSDTPKPTYTPTITPTDTPESDITSSPGYTEEAQQQPRPTVDWSASKPPECTFTATKPGVRIYPAPFIDPYHILPTMEPGKPYPAVLTKPTYTLLLEEGQPLGWVDYRLIAVTHDGDDCLSHQDDREITDFTNLCFFTPKTEIYGYSDSEFTEPMHDLYPSTSFIVLNQSNDSYFTAYGSSGPSFVVKKEEVYLHGNCAVIPTLARAVVETPLYSEPPDQGGTIIYTLSIDEPIYTQSKSVSGSPPPGVDGTGYWTLVRRHSWSEDINGWVWLDHIEYK